MKNPFHGWGMDIFWNHTFSTYFISNFQKNTNIDYKKKKFALKMYQFDTKRVNVMENHHQKYSKADVLRRISSLEHVA